LETIDDVRRLTNRGLAVRGLVATLFDPRTRHSREVLRDLIARYQLPLVGPPVRRSVRFAESPTEGTVLVGSGTDVPGTAAYRAIARELLGLPVDHELLDAAGWSEAQRADVLGLADGSEGPG
jgi:chromosome partitioning protein